ncbi:MAG: 50S ribosomal protein L32 [Patescibacteria group bacterium]
MVIRMRHTRAHTANRRSHHALKPPRLSKCAKCGVAHLRHRVCLNCGVYRGRVVFDPAVKSAKIEKKKKKGK